jgi:hypothetical protein
MDKPEFKKQVIQNLQGTDLRDYSLTNADLNILSGWTYIAMFLIEAKTSLLLSENKNKEGKFTEMEQVILANGMFKNFILSYSKCFSSSGKEKISLNAKEIFSKRPDLFVTHEKILQARNTYVAHNDENDFEVSISMTSENNNEIILAQTYTIITPLPDYKSFSDTIEFCEEQVILKFNKKVDKIQARLGKIINFKQT